MSEAVEPAIADEEVLLEIFHHPLHLTFGSGPARTAGTRQEVIVVGQQQEPGVEHHFPIVIFQHRRFLVINQYGFHTVTEVAEGANQRLIGMFSILLWRGKDMEATGEPQRINREVNFASLPGDLHLNFVPVVLQLVTGLGFEADCFLRRAHFAFGLDVIAQHGATTGVTHRFDFCEDDLAIPDIFGQTCIYIIHKRLQFGHFMARLSGRWFRVFKIPSDGAFRATHLSCNVDNVRTLLTHLFYHVKVLSAQHVDVLSGVRTSRKQHVGWSGHFKW